MVQSSPQRAGSIRQRIDAVRDRVDIAALINRVVKLGRGANPRGKCPFHGSKSDSFAVQPSHDRARCWGCGWTGDAIKFVQDYYGLSFMDALERLETDVGLDNLAPAPTRREKWMRVEQVREAVDSATMARFIWANAKPDLASVRQYLGARGVDATIATDERLRDVRFLDAAPIRAWLIGSAADSVPRAPAIVAMVRRAGSWERIGLHVTYLTPALTAKMARKRPDGWDYPSRKMLGSMVGGCVMLGRYEPDAALFVGEGLETVQSGMHVLAAKPDACGMAVLSLDNLQGSLRLWRGAWPLHEPLPNPNGTAAVTLAHRGPVTGLIDADMKPLRGPIDPRSNTHRGVPVIEQRGGPIVRRTITTAERAEVCSALFTAAWRARGCRASAVRPRMGLDFNDLWRERA